MCATATFTICFYHLTIVNNNGLVTAVPGQIQNAQRLRSLLGLIYPLPVGSPWPYNQQDYYEDVDKLGRKARNAFDPNLPAELIRAMLSREDRLRLREVAGILDDWVVGSSIQDWDSLMCETLYANTALKSIDRAGSLNALTYLGPSCHNFVIRLRLDDMQALQELAWEVVLIWLQSFCTITISIDALEDLGNIATVWTMLTTIRTTLETYEVDGSVAKVEYLWASDESKDEKDDLEDGLDITAEELLDWEEDLQFLMDS